MMGQALNAMMQKQLSGIKAAELGNADAITNLGIMYENGEGVKGL